MSGGKREYERKGLDSWGVKIQRGSLIAQKQQRPKSEMSGN
jgi:hypothetical protein